MQVLVPFDVGVVYIFVYIFVDIIISFSPLRCWGGLYHNKIVDIPGMVVLVPFDVGVVYIKIGKETDFKL